MKVIQLSCSFTIAIILAFSTLGAGASVVNIKNTCNTKLSKPKLVDDDALSYVGATLSYPSFYITTRVFQKIGCK